MGRIVCAFSTHKQAARGAAEACEAIHEANGQATLNASPSILQASRSHGHGRSPDTSVRPLPSTPLPRPWPDSC
jgi:hypothetical protein